MIKTLKVLSFASLGLALGATVASAEIVCNEDGDCWRVKERYEYSPELRLRVQPNTWRWSDADKDRFRWREVPPGKSERGYWRRGVWVEIE